MSVMKCVILILVLVKYSEESESASLQDNIRRLRNILNIHQRATGCPAKTDNNEISVPDPYLDDSDCAWRIALQPGESLLITVTMMEIEVDSTTDNNNTCHFDYLSINGVKYCGVLVAPAFDIEISNQATVEITFTSDSTIHFGGFNLRYAIMRSSVTDSSLASGGPSSADLNRFESMLPCTTDENGCCLNYCEFGYETLRITTCPSYCTCKTSGPSCGLEFDCPVAWSFGLGHCPYCACYNTAKLSRVLSVDRTCLSTVDTEYGVLGNPLLGNVYPNKARCLSTIRGRKGPLLLLVAYDIEDEIACQYDSLHIGTNAQMGHRLSRYCGKGTHMFKVDTAKTDIEIKFLSDEYIQKSGFIIGFSYRPLEMRKFDLVNLKEGKYQMTSGGTALSKIRLYEVYVEALKIKNGFDSLVQNLHDIYDSM